MGMYGRESNVRGGAPDAWPLNGTYGYGLGSRVVAPYDGREVRGLAVGALHDRDVGWLVAIRDGRGRQAPIVRVRAALVKADPGVSPTR